MHFLNWRIAGLAATGWVITSAGFVLAGTFAVLATIPSTFTTELGFAVAFAFRIILVIPIAIVLAAVTGEGLQLTYPSHSYGVTAIPSGAGGALVIGPFLMILFRRKYPGGGSTGTWSCSGSSTGSASTCP
jgi:hypothetical protein